MISNFIKFWTIKFSWISFCLILLFLDLLTTLTNDLLKNFCFFIIMIFSFYLRRWVLYSCWTELCTCSCFQDSIDLHINPNLRLNLNKSVHCTMYMVLFTRFYGAIILKLKLNFDKMYRSSIKYLINWLFIIDLINF